MSVESIPLTILDLHVLQSVRYVLAIVGGLLEKLVDLLELHDPDGIGLVLKQIAYCVAAQLIRGFFQPVDLDAMADQRQTFGQRSEGLLQRVAQD